MAITISKAELDDYICITDIAAAKSKETRAADIVKNWLRNRNTLEFLGTWEQIYNPDFKVVEFDHFRREAGLHTFVISVSEWIDQTNAIGLLKKDDMEEPLHIRISLLSLHRQLILFLNYI